MGRKEGRKEGNTLASHTTEEGIRTCSILVGVYLNIVSLGSVYMYMFVFINMYVFVFVNSTFPPVRPPRPRLPSCDDHLHIMALMWHDITYLHSIIHYICIYQVQKGIYVYTCTIGVLIEACPFPHHTYVCIHTHTGIHM